MKNKFIIGDRVTVMPEPDDTFSHEFSGKVVDILEKKGDALFIVEDQDSDFFTVFDRQMVLIED